MKAKPHDDCSGCNDPHSEGTHQQHTIQHPCPEGGDPNCGYCFPNEWEARQSVKDKPFDAPNTSCCEKCSAKGKFTGGTMRITHDACICADCPCHQSSHSEGKTALDFIVANFRGKLRAYNVPEERIEAIGQELADDVSKLLSERERPPKDGEFLSPRDMFFFEKGTSKGFAAGVEAERAKFNATEIAERIVIEYANATGREEKFRPYVREAAFKVLSALLTNHQTRG